MKLKKGFVTNSSSTSYIMFIPDDFEPEKHYDRFKELWKNETDVDIISLEKFKEQFKPDNKWICSYDIDDSEDGVYCFATLLTELGLECTNFDGASDDATVYLVHANAIYDIKTLWEANKYGRRNDR